jgi:DUF1680 family protein
MATSRRDFVQRSATAAAALSLGPLAPLANAAAAAEPPTTLEHGDAGHAHAPVPPASIRAFERRLMRARPLPLASVRLTGGPLKHAQDLDVAYLKELEPDRMLHYYRVQAGLPSKAEGYKGWDDGGRQLTGHIAGHYLSAVSYMYAATGDPEFKRRADYIVRALKEVQDKHGNGYCGALEGAEKAFAEVSKGNIRSGGFDLNGLWSPWYTLHKTYAGLRDAYRETGNRQALDVETKFAAWAEQIVAPLSYEQMQRMMLTEFGGMNEVFADLYADTGDARWLKLSYRFEHDGFTRPLKRHQDNLGGKHANTNIPKLIGSAARYGYVADAADLEAASFFTDRIAQHHTYATGGHGQSEYWGPADQIGVRVDGRTSESCNAYNMAKLTRRLASFRPDADYADYNERWLFNHVLASIDPEDGRTCYMVPVGRGVQQEYQDMQRSFTCCVGSGMENHALHGQNIYFENDDTLWVNLFIPSTAEIDSGALKGVRVSQTTDFPEGETATVTLTVPQARKFTLAVRRPTWAGDGFRIAVNGEALAQPTLAALRASGGGRASREEEARPQPSSYVEIERTWKTGDKIELTLPKSLRLEPTPDQPQVAAIMWGPLVLAGDLGPRREGRGRVADGSATNAPAPQPVPVLVTGGKALAEWVVPSGKPNEFVAKGVAMIPEQQSAPGDVALAPFYRTHRRRYSGYFDILTPEQYEARGAALAAERERVRKLEAATVGFVQPGEMQPERDFNYQSEPLERPVLRAEGRANRAGPGWFSFDLPVDPSAPTAVVVTYLNALGLAPASGNFEILVDGTPVGTFEPNTTAIGFWDARYAVPASLVQGKSKVTVRFQAAPNGRVAPVFGVRTVRANAL